MRIPRPLAGAIGAALLLQAPVTAGADPCGPTAYDCALFHVNRGEFTEAVRYLEQQLTATSHDLKALNLLGIALTGAGNREAANGRFREALAIDPAFHPARRNLAVNEYDSGRLAAARTHFEVVLKTAPADEVAHLYLGEIHYAAKDWTTAASHYDRSGERFLQDPLSTLHYGQCLLATGRRPQALLVLDRIPEGAGTPLFEAGVALGKAGALAEAARFFGRARGSYPDPYAATYNETLMLLEAGDAEAALRIVRTAEDEGRAPAELMNLASRAYVSTGRIQEAYDALRKATRLEPKAPENYLDLASICVEHDNFDLGLEIADIGLRQLPDSWMLHVQRGALLAMKGRLQEAEEDFERARRLAPDQAVPFAALGMVWMQSGQAARAVEVLRAELPRRRDHVVPYIFAVALLRSGIEPSGPEAGEAVAALRASIVARPDFAPSRAELGRLLFKRDEVDAAIVELERAAELDPAGTPALYILSQAYRKKGERAKAQDLLARVNQRNAQQRGDDQEGELQRAVLRIVREGTAPPPRSPLEP